MPRVRHPKYRRRHLIREWRLHRGQTQQKLAERLGTTRALISRVENLKPGHTQNMLEGCAAALLTDPASLIMRNPMDAEATWLIWDIVSR